MDNTREISDFYHQLGLLLRSGLPLPESLRKLGENLGRSGFRRALFELDGETSGGGRLSEAMRKHPKYFTGAQVAVIAAGENSGNLPEVLAELAEAAKVKRQLVILLKEATMFPLFTLYFALLVLFLLLVFFVPGFCETIADLDREWKMPGFLVVVEKISWFVSAYPLPFVAFFVGFPVLVAWLYSGFRSSERCLLWVVRFIPNVSRIFRDLTAARVCRLWAVLLRQKVPEADAFKFMAATGDSPCIARALQRAAEKCRRGISPIVALNSERRIPWMIPMAVEHASQTELPRELEELSEIYREQCALRIRRSGIVWETMVIILSAVIIGALAVCMIMPMLVILNRLGSY